MPETNVLITLSAIMFIGIAGWLLLIFGFPRKWESITRAEYDFHCRKKWIPEKFARFQRDFALGKGLKITLISMCFSVLVCLISLLRSQ